MLKTSHKKIQNTDIKEDDKIIDIYLWIDKACVIFSKFFPARKLQQDR